MKKVMSSAMLNKLHIFAQSGWKEALLEEIDADVLPDFLGGNRTDPDGNPLCHLLPLNIHHEGKVDPKYFLSDEERHFKDPSNVRKVTIPPKRSLKIPVTVERGGSLIEWEFEVKHKDIGFGLFYQLNELELDELLPVQRMVTVDGSERDNFRAERTGKYLILFDNSHGWWYSKEVEYCVTVKDH